MRFVPVKNEAGQAMITLHRIRASFVERRTAVANQLRATFSEFGIVAPVGESGLNDLLELVETRGEEIAHLPEALVLVLEELARQWRGADIAVANLERVIRADLRAKPRAKTLTQVPSIGPMGASAIEAHLPDPHVFRSGRDFAAWMGLTPGIDKSANTVRKMGITKKGDGYLRRTLVLAATMRLALIRRGRAKGVSAWERRMAAHPKRKLAAVALANKSARIAWAMLAKNENYRAPVEAPAAAA
jgi:transposase